MAERNGFTLIELLVVIAIIGILATIVILNVNGAKAKANDAKIKDTISSLNKAIQISIASNGAYIGGSYGVEIEIDPSQPSAQILINNLTDDSSNKLFGTQIPSHPLHDKNGRYKFLANPDFLGNNNNYILYGTLSNLTYDASLQVISSNDIFICSTLNNVAIVKQGCNINSYNSIASTYLP